jgi:hypothetical protein
MTSFYETFSTDPELEAGKGIDLDYGPCGVITVHRAGGANRMFTQVFAAKMKPYERRIANGTLEDDLAERLLAETYAETVIVGWRGVKGPDGKDLAFNRKNAVKLLTELPDLFRDIQEQTTRITNFRRENLEEAAKNSRKSSASN